MMSSKPLSDLHTGDEIVVKPINAGKHDALDPPTVLDPIRPVKVQVRQELDRRAPIAGAPTSGVQLSAPQQVAAQRAAPTAPAARVAQPQQPEEGSSKLPWAIAAIAIGIMLGVGASAFVAKRAPSAAPVVTAETAAQASPQATATDDTIVFGGKISRPEPAKTEPTAEAKPPATTPAQAVAQADPPKPEPKGEPKPEPPKVEAKPAPPPAAKPVAKAEPTPAPKPQPEAKPAEPPKVAAKPTAEPKPTPVKPAGKGNDVEAAARDAELLKKQLAETIP